MNSTPQLDDLARLKSTPDQRGRRKIAREVVAMYDDIARESGFGPTERRTSMAISIRLYERAGEDCETPRGISLAAIGSALTSKSDTEKARTDRARDHVGQLFNHSIPRTGYQILTRYKAEEDSGRPHEYADHLMPLAAFFSELLAEETDRILSIKELDRKAKREKIEDARQRLIAEAVTWLPKCEAELVAPSGEVYAYVSAPEAKAYCAKNPHFTARPYRYTPLAEKEEQPRPFYSQDFDRIEEQIKTTIEKKLDEILERNSFDEARQFIATRLDKGIPKMLSSWVKVAAAGDRSKEVVDEEEKRINHVGESGGVPVTEAEIAPVENYPVIEADTPPNFGGVDGDNPANPSDLKNHLSEIVPVENFPESASPLVASINFDTALDAAFFYARDGRPVIPICNFNPATGRCTGPDWHTKDPKKPCTGKRPLVKGKGKRKLGDGYTAATTDMGKIRHWFERQFSTAGVGIRLDDHVLIDCDLKGGGPESYEFLRDTFDIPETLTAITQSGGRHYVFKLPDELPADWLKSWTRPLEKIALDGIDLKVGKRGLLYAEPTIGSKGVYRWVDPTVAPATLPRECCDFLHEIRYKDDKPKVDKPKADKPKIEKPKAEKTRQTRVYSSSDAPQASQEIDPDQEKYFVDAARGDRHKRLLKIARKIRAIGGDAAQIKKALKYHASRFSDPLSDEPWIERVAAECVLKFKPGEASV